MIHPVLALFILCFWALTGWWGHLGIFCFFVVHIFFSHPVSILSSGGGDGGPSAQKPFTPSWLHPDLEASNWLHPGFILIHPVSILSGGASTGTILVHPVSILFRWGQSE